MKLVDALVMCLRDWGVEHLFGVSGANVEHLHDAVIRLGVGRLQAILTKSEVGASFMADGGARVHGRLGVCCSTSGGGMMNLAVGIAESYAESVPVLAIVGQSPRALNGKGAFQDSSGIGRTVDALSMWNSITKYAGVVQEPKLFWEQLQEAVGQALGGRQGPVALLVPRDCWELEVGTKPTDFPQTLEELVKNPPTTNEIAARSLFAHLKSYQAPVLLLGTGVARSPQGSEVIRFAQNAGVPVVTTMGNCALFPQDDPLYLGIVGVAGHPSAHDYLNEHCDFIVAVGAGLNALTRGPIQQAFERARTAIVNLDPGEAIRSVESADVVVGDAGDVFAVLNHRLNSQPFFKGRPFGYRRSYFVSQLVRPTAQASNDEPEQLLQSQAIDILNAYLPKRGHILFDAGNCAATSMHYLNIPPSCTTTIALGMGGMGYAIAAAIGVQLGAEEGTETIVFCGDGAFLMHGLEIHTAVEKQLPILFVVFNNQKHGMCLTRQQVFFDGREGYTSYEHVDIAQIGLGLGGEGSIWVAKVSTKDELEACLTKHRARLKKGPAIIELLLPEEEIPPFTPFLAKGAPTYEVEADSVLELKVKQVGGVS